MINVNDLARNVSPGTIVKNILLMSLYNHGQKASLQLHVQSILSGSALYGKPAGNTIKVCR
ncbi:MAG: hypothetical protein ABJB86_10925 [Bacteroidota bacterium]